MLTNPWDSTVPQVRPPLHQSYITLSDAPGVRPCNITLFSFPLVSAENIQQQNR